MEVAPSERLHTGTMGAPRTPAEGAETPIWLATEAPADLHGRFVRDRSVIPF